MLCNNNKPFLNRIVTCNEKHILYDNQWQPAPCSKALPKARLHQKKVTVPVWWSAACLIHYSFLNPIKTITSEKYAQQIDEDVSKTTMPAASIGQQKGQTLL